MNILDTFNNDDQNSRVKPVYGVVTGVVTNNQDPDELGRVKVRINVFEDNHETDWAHVATLMAGSGRGSFFLPELNDEVLVAFEHGNINAPYVVGALWNGKDKPPDTNSDGENNIRKIRSRSGHEIVFSDDPDGEKLEIKTNGGHSIALDDTEGKENVAIKSKAGHKLVLDDASGNEKIEIKTKASHGIILDDGNEDISIKDVNGNKIEMSKNGIVLSDANGNKITMGSAGVDINGKFSIGS